MQLFRHSMPLPLTAWLSVTDCRIALSSLFSLSGTATPEHQRGCCFLSWHDVDSTSLRWMVEAARAVELCSKVQSSTAWWVSLSSYTDMQSHRVALSITGALHVCKDLCRLQTTKMHVVADCTASDRLNHAFHDHCRARSKLTTR